MKLLTIDAPRGGRPGALSANGEIIDLLKLDPGEGLGTWLPTSVRSILDAGPEGLDMVRRLVDQVNTADGSEAGRLAELGALLPYDGAPLLAPVPDPRLILSEGRNYGKHLAEMGGEKPPSYPTAFIKLQSSLIICPAWAPLETPGPPWRSQGSLLLSPGILLGGSWALLGHLLSLFLLKRASCASRDQKSCTFWLKRAS